MRGLRTQEGSKFEEFFKIVQEAAEKKGGVFFLDCGEGREIETESLSVSDLTGWLIPFPEADKFEKDFLADKIDREGWAEHLFWAIWFEEDGKIGVEIKEF